MAVVDEASIRITPDTSGFAAELRRELQSEIAAATAGLDDVIHIRVEVDADAARAGLAQALQDFENEGRNSFRGLRDEQQDLFDDIRVNTERTRDKVVLETTKTRDRINARLAPFWAKLKLKLLGTKKDFENIKKAAEDAGKAAGKSFGADELAKQEKALAAAYERATQAAARMAVVQQQLDAQRLTSETRSRALENAEKALAEARANADESVYDLGVAERALQLTREQANADLDDIRAGEREVAQLRKEADAATKAAVQAENALNQAREQAANSAEKVVVSEEKMETLRKKLATATEESTAAEERLTAARNEAEQAAARNATVMGRMGNALTGLNLGLDRGNGYLGIFGGALKGASVAGSLLSGAVAAGSAILNTFQGATDKAAEAAQKGATSLLAFAAGMVQLGAKSTAFIAIGGVVAYAIGAIGAALAGIPALAMGAAVALGAVVLGVKGITVAFNAELKPALDELSTQLEDVFEARLRPAFDNLANNLIPQITTNMKGLAGAIADVIGDLADMVTQGENVRKINDIINNMTAAITGQLNPALQNIVQRFIDIAAQRPVMDAMVGIIADLINNTANWLAEMDRLNLIVPAVQALRATLNNLVTAFFDILTSATNFFTVVQPGFDALVDGVTSVVTALLDRLGPAIRDIMQAFGDALKQIGPEVWDQLRDAVQRVADKLQEMANNGNLTFMFEALIRVVSGAIDAFATFIGWIDNLVSSLRGASTSTDGFVEGLTRMTDGFVDALASVGLLPPRLDETGAAANTAGGAVDQFGNRVGALPGQVQPPMNNTATAIEESMRRAQAAAREGGQGVHDGVVTPLPAMQQTTQVSFDTLPPTVQNAMVGAEAAARTGSELVSTAVRTGFDNAANSAQIATARINTETSANFTAMSNAVSTNMQSAQTAVETAGSAMQEQMTTTAQSVNNSGQVIADALQKVGEAALQAQTVVTGAMEGMRTAVESALQGIQTAFQTTFQQMDQIVTSTMEKIKTTIQTNLQQAEQFIKQTLDQIRQNWQTTHEQMVQLTEQGWQQINAAIKAGGEQAIAECERIAEEILQVFKDLAPELEAAGNEMMQRLAAGITAGGAAAVAAAQSVAAQIKAQFPASPAKEGPLSGRGDPLRTGGVIIQRLADGMRAAQSYLMRQLVPIMNATARVLRLAPPPMATSGWSVTSSTASNSEPSPIRLLDTPSSAPDTEWWRRGANGPVRHGSVSQQEWDSLKAQGWKGRAGDGMEALYPPEQLRAALQGLTIRIEDDGRAGLAKIVNRQQRTLGRR